jgi:arginine exporter protein ArgO
MKAYSWFVIGALAASVAWMVVVEWLLVRLTRARAFSLRGRTC